jgi:hypothetical protein
VIVWFGTLGRKLRFSAPGYLGHRDLRSTFGFLIIFKGGILLMGVFAVSKVYLPVNIELVFGIKIIFVESFINNLVVVGQIYDV